MTHIISQNFIYSKPKPSPQTQPIMGVVVESIPNTTSRPPVFTVRRHTPELLTPAKPTPRELKPLSDIDDQKGLRLRQQRLIFYRKNEPAEGGRDPVKVIRKAIAEALVFYYPWAGRLKEGENRKLYVDCTGDGVVFVEADADVRLEDFGDEHLCPPFSGSEELVTRLRCGGFVIAVSNTHSISDATGVVHFLNAVSDMARDATTPSRPPVWDRELLNARDPPRTTFSHPEYDEIHGDFVATDDLGHEGDPDYLSSELIYRSFFFGSHEITRLRELLPQHLQSTCTSFELLVSCPWRCRTAALQLHSDEEVRLCFAVNARSKFNPPLPAGYYGNACAFPAVVSTAGKICGRPLSYILELVQKVKASISEEYMRSLADFLVIKGRPYFTTAKSFLVSDLTRTGFAELDFGWGKPTYSGVANSGDIPNILSFIMAFTNSKGLSGKLVPMCLPKPAMERFVKELEHILN